MRTLDVYDSLREILLDVKFEYSENPEYVRTFRSSYASIRQLLIPEDKLNLDDNSNLGNRFISKNRRYRIWKT